MKRQRPNIVWLLTDHHAFRHHVGLGPRLPAMPAYRRVAAEGVEFTRAQAVCPLCTPARASMLTGVYPHRHEMVMNNGDCGSRLDFEADARLFSHFLGEAGYRCGYFGKWHVATDALASNMDLMPTVLDAAGAEMPPVHGASLLPVARKLLAHLA